IEGDFHFTTQLGQKTGGQELIRAVVFDDENAAPAREGGSRRGGCTAAFVHELGQWSWGRDRRGRRGRWGDGHGEPERGALFIGARAADRSAHQLDEPFADGQAETGSAKLSRGRAVDLAELLEEQG